MQTELNIAPEDNRVELQNHNSTEHTCSNTNTKSVPVDFIDTLLSIPFILLFALTLLVFEILQRLAFAISPKCHTFSVVLLNKTIVSCLKVLGTKIEVFIPFTLIPNQTYIIVSNHQSLFDIPLLHITFAKVLPKFIAKKELAHNIPSVSFNLRHGGCLTIDRKNGRQAVTAMANYAKTVVQNKWSIVIFPEGTRARNGELKEFHSAGFQVLIKHIPNALIIPVALDGSWKLASRKYWPIPRNIKVSIKAGAALSQGGKTAKLFEKEVFDNIHNLFNELRSI